MPGISFCPLQFGKSCAIMDYGRIWYDVKGWELHGLSLCYGLFPAKQKGGEHEQKHHTQTRRGEGGTD